MIIIYLKNTFLIVIKDKFYLYFTYDKLENDVAI